MQNHSLTFDAVQEATPGPKWAARWARSWPAYEAWFLARGGDAGPTRAACEAALEKYMPELTPVHRQLTDLAGGSDRAARFLSTWCPPTYLGGCSLAVVTSQSATRLVRNYDLSPDLNEGLLLHSAWCGRPVMGMVEFLWGLSDGINAAGLCIALAYGGRQDVGVGFGITTILRYVLETCDTVDQALTVLNRVPSHMRYNVVLADAAGAAASVELYAGGGSRVQPNLLATNHQNDGSVPDRGAFTRTYQRATHLAEVTLQNQDALALAPAFKTAPLVQDRYGEGFGTLFTAEYDPNLSALTLHWADDTWAHRIDAFTEGQRVVRYADGSGKDQPNPSLADSIDWVAVGMRYANGEAVDWRDLCAQWSPAA